MLSSRKAIILGSILVALAIAAGAAFFASTKATASKESGSAEKEQAKPLQLDADALRRAGIQVQRIDAADFAETLTAFGTIGPNRNSFARVTTPIAGRVTKIAVDLGSPVAGDAPLAVLELFGGRPPRVGCSKTTLAKYLDEGSIDERCATLACDEQQQQQPAATRACRSYNGK